MRKAPACPDITKDYQEYGALNPAYQPGADERTVREVNRLVFTDETCEEAYSPARIAENIGLFQRRIRAKIAQLKSNPAWRELGSGSEDDFRACPRTLLKTLQEILCGDTERMCFDRRDSRLDPAGRDFAGAHLIIDPDCITDTLLANLGLNEFIADHGSKMEKYERRTQAIPRIKDMLRHLEPPLTTTEHGSFRDLRYFRLMRMAAGPRKGFVLGTQHIGEQKVLFSTDIDGAERRLEHIEKQYQEEIRKLIFIRLTLERVILELGNWKQMKKSQNLESQLETIRTELVSCVNLLKFVTNEHKMTLREAILYWLQFKDHRGRYNPSAMRKGLRDAIDKNLAVRLREIERIWRYIGEDKAKVAELVEIEETPLREFTATAENLHDRFAILTGRPLTDDEKRKIKNNLTRLKAAAERIKFKPNLSFGEKFTAKIDAVSAVLDNPHADSVQTSRQAAAEFLKIYFVAKLKRCHGQLLELYKRCSKPAADLDLLALAAEAGGIKTHLQEKLVAPNVITPDCDGIFHAVYGLLDEIEKALRQPYTAQSAQQQGAAPELSGQPSAPHQPSRFEEIVSRLSALPILGKFMPGIADRIKNFFVRAKPRAASPQRSARAAAPAAPRLLTAEEKTAALEQAKNLIREFPFAQMVRQMP